MPCSAGRCGPGEAALRARHGAEAIRQPRTTSTISVAVGFLLALTSPGNGGAPGTATLSPLHRAGSVRRNEPGLLGQPSLPVGLCPGCKYSVQFNGASGGCAGFTALQLRGGGLEGYDNLMEETRGPNKFVVEWDNSEGVYPPRLSERASLLARRPALSERPDAVSTLPPPVLKPGSGRRARGA
jgi:hypothetical protein